MVSRLGPPCCCTASQLYTDCREVLQGPGQQTSRRGTAACAAWMGRCTKEASGLACGTAGGSSPPLLDASSAVRRLVGLQILSHLASPAGAAPTV